MQPRDHRREGSRIGEPLKPARLRPFVAKRGESLLGTVARLAAVDLVPLADASETAQARRGNRAVRSPKTRTVKRRKKPRQRADRGELRADRSPMRNTISAGLRPATASYAPTLKLNVGVSPRAQAPR